MTSLSLSHFHVGVEDLNASKAWLQDKLELTPEFCNESLAYYRMAGGPIIVFERAPRNLPVTIALGTENCDELYQKAVAKGARIVTPPQDQKWGVRSAYVEGPGAVTIEIEQVVPS